MKRLSLNVTAEFDRDLRQFMKQRKISRKSDAIRQALREAAERSAGAGKSDFRSWLGMGLKAPVRAKARFRHERDLWS